MADRGIGHLGHATWTGLALAAAVAGIAVVSGPVGRWWNPETVPTQPASVSAEADVALRSALAGHVTSATARRPWQVEFGSVALPIAVTNQRGSNWCWAATAASVAAYYGNHVSQCSLVQAGSPVASFLGGCPDLPGTPSQQAAALTAAGIPAVVVERALTPVDTKAQIDAGRPVLAHLAPVGGTVGHAFLVRGYDAAGGLLLADPRPDRRDAALAWHSLPSRGVPYDVLTAGEPASIVLTGHGSDGTDVYREHTAWTETVLVASPGQLPSLLPAAVPVWQAQDDGTSASTPDASPTSGSTPASATAGGRAI